MPSSTMPVPPVSDGPVSLAPAVAAQSAGEPGADYTNDDDDRDSLDIDVTVDQDPTSAAVHPRYPRSPSGQQLGLSGASAGLTSLTASTSAATAQGGEYYPLATGRGLTPTEVDGKLVDADGSEEVGDMVLELSDGTAFEGMGFGANRSVGGECVFQTGEAEATSIAGDGFQDAGD